MVFFLLFFPLLERHKEVTKMKPGKSSTETGSAVPHISDTFSSLISLPELQDTRFNYSNLRLRSLKLVQKTITLSHRFLLVCLLQAAESQTQLCQLSWHGFFQLRGRSGPAPKKSHTWAAKLTPLEGDTDRGSENNSPIEPVWRASSTLAHVLPEEQGCSKTTLETEILPVNLQFGILPSNT